MAYRRRQQVGKDTNYGEEVRSTYNPPPVLDGDDGGISSSPSASSIAAKAIRASSAYRDSSLSLAYGQTSVSSPRGSVSARTSPPSLDMGTSSDKSTSLKNSIELKQGFWGVIARKAKTILDDDDGKEEHEALDRTGFKLSSRGTTGQYDVNYQPTERRPVTEGPTLQKGLGALASSLDYIGGRIGNAIEEGLNVVESRTADIIQETRKLQIKRRGNKPVLDRENLNFGTTQKLSTMHNTTVPQSESQTDLDIQLKASRDVAMAMAAKAKLLLRELKTVKADLAFAKERCAQLEEENKFIRESRENGDNLEDDDLIRLQLESLLAEKARLAQENSVFSRENRFLREIVEYHQLTMQDVVYLDETSEEVTEIHPVRVPSSSYSPSDTSSNGAHTQPSKDAVTPLSSYIHMHKEDSERH